MVRLYVRSRRNPAYRQRLSERFGFIQLIKKEKSIWVHTVSLGESIAATPLIQALIDQYSTHTLVVTTTTPTGSAHIQKQFGSAVYHCYAPIDLPIIVHRFLKQLRPAIVIILETELWPNWLYQFKKANIPVMIANARLSPRSFARYQRVKRFFKPLLHTIARVATQTKEDHARFQTLGLTEKQLTVTGNLKFDQIIPPQCLSDAKKLRAHWPDRPTLIAASTHAGEETLLLTAFREIQRIFPNAFFILVPRHPERFAAVSNLCQQLKYSVAIRSQNQIPTPTTDIYLADTTGELLTLYAAADVAFVGGSLIAIGGHNLIEPASLGIPIITGPYLDNFLAVRDVLLDHQALLLAKSAADIATHVIALFSDTEKRHQYSARALCVSEDNRGALQKHLHEIQNLIHPHPTQVNFR